MRRDASFLPHSGGERVGVRGLGACMGRGLLIAAIAALAACSRPPTVIDGSSANTFAATTEQARRDLPIEDRLIFDTALRTIGGRRHANSDPDAMARRLFDGMTAAEVVADARARGIQ